MATICFVFNKKYQMNFIKKLFIKKVQDSFTEAPAAQSLPTLS
jgi:hypothetical protein